MNVSLTVKIVNHGWDHGWDHGSVGDGALGEVFGAKTENTIDANTIEPLRLGSDADRLSADGQGTTKRNRICIFLSTEPP